MPTHALLYLPAFCLAAWYNYAIMAGRTFWCEHAPRKLELEGWVAAVMGKAVPVALQDCCAGVSPAGAHQAVSPSGCSFLFA